jgi:hypothetical protein
VRLPVWSVLQWGVRELPGRDWLEVRAERLRASQEHQDDHNNQGEGDRGIAV